MTKPKRLSALICIIILAAMSHAQGASIQQSPDTKVIIIGAGISGLIAALRLQHAGIDVVVLEKEPQVGLYLRNMPKSKPVAMSVFHNESLNAFLRQTKKPAQNETVISLNIAGTEAYKMTDEEILQRVSHTLQKIYPDFDPEKNISDYSIKRWKDGIVRYPPGFLTKYQDAIRAPLGRVHFGGDYTHSPALDGAAWSGVRAADQILSALDSSK